MFIKTIHGLHFLHEANSNQSANREKSEAKTK